ncbi:hypothetical protein [Enterobacter phage vB_ExiM_F5M1E]|nr:hypothetical protein [Enterobacter phage vB_ExiM_F5M1E]
MGIAWSSCRIDRLNNELQGGIIRQIKGRKAKVEVLGTISKWKDGNCMVKLPD